MMDNCSKITPGSWKVARKETWRFRMRSASSTRSFGNPSWKRLCQGKGGGEGEALQQQDTAGND